MLAEFCSQEENWVVENSRRNFFVTFALVADMDEAMINAHLELVW
jgi:hypothetical protein